jgi:hypothetical protein
VRARSLGAIAIAAAASAWIAAGGCGAGGSGGAGGTGGTGAIGGGAGGSLNAVCSLETRLGGFAVKLVEAPGTQPITAIDGGVRNGVLPSDVWQQKGAAAGTCRLMVGPMLMCATPCTSPQICAGQNQCIDSPTYQDAGAVTITGVGPSPLTLNPLNPAQKVFAYSTSLSDPYPPFSPGSAVTLRNAGATIPAFSLEAAGIQPLVFEGANLTMRNGEALPFTWTAPAGGSASPILVEVEIGHHGGVSAHINCDLPDTGSGEIPASLVSALIAEGVHGFPTLSLTRRSVSSASVAGGCVDLAVAAHVQRNISVCPTASSCIVSCVSSAECPTPMTCKPDYTCG